MLPTARRAATRGRDPNGLAPGGIARSPQGDGFAFDNAGPRTGSARPSRSRGLVSNCEGSLHRRRGYRTPSLWLAAAGTGSSAGNTAPEYWYEASIHTTRWQSAIRGRRCATSLLQADAFRVAARAADRFRMGGIAQA